MIDKNHVCDTNDMKKKEAIAYQKKVNGGIVVNGGDGRDGKKTCTICGKTF